MQMTTEARAWLDGTVRRIMARHPLGDPERAGIHYELMSHVHAAAEAHASAAGRAEVSTEDLEAAVNEAGGEAGLAAAFVEPLSRPLERKLFWRRAGAFAIDAFLLGIALSFVHGMVVMLLESFMPGAGGEAHNLRHGWELMPWGFHDARLSPALQAAIACASALVVMGYYTWFEGHEGRSLGKRAVGLRVLRPDARPVTYREAFLRNLVKLAPLILILDTLLMLIFFRRDKQRVSDKIAETIVIRS
jgi:uncharacterized RDD family membrane protein YckC